MRLSMLLRTGAVTVHKINLLENHKMRTTVTPTYRIALSYDNVLQNRSLLLKNSTLGGGKYMHSVHTICLLCVRGVSSCIALKCTSGKIAHKCTRHSFPCASPSSAKRRKDAKIGIITRKTKGKLCSSWPHYSTPKTERIEGRCSEVQLLLSVLMVLF